MDFKLYTLVISNYSINGFNAYSYARRHASNKCSTYDKLHFQWLPDILKGPKGIIMVLWFNISQTEIMIEISSKSLVRRVGQVLFIKIS